MPSPGPAEIVVILVIIAIFVIPIAAILVWMRRSQTARLGAPERDAALDSLRSRLATGEIDETEYQRLRSVLQGD